MKSLSLRHFINWKKVQMTVQILFKLNKPQQHGLLYFSRKGGFLIWLYLLLLCAMLLHRWAYILSPFCQMFDLCHAIHTACTYDWETVGSVFRMKRYWRQENCKQMCLDKATQPKFNYKHFLHKLELLSLYYDLKH